jgi:hypothetical protein
LTNGLNHQRYNPIFISFIARGANVSEANIGAGRIDGLETTEGIAVDGTDVGCVTHFANDLLEDVVAATKVSVPRLDLLLLGKRSTVGAASGFLSSTSIGRRPPLNSQYDFAPNHVT